MGIDWGCCGVACQSFRSDTDDPLQQLHPLSRVDVLDVPFPDIVVARSMGYLAMFLDFRMGGFRRVRTEGGSRRSLGRRLHRRRDESHAIVRL
jgi:hypothetical protein